METKIIPTTIKFGYQDWFPTDNLDVDYNEIELSNEQITGTYKEDENGLWVEVILGKTFFTREPKRYWIHEDNFWFRYTPEKTVKYFNCKEK